MVFEQLLINGLIAGAIYALVASGFSLIYSVCKFVNLAHGATVLIAGYFLYYVYSVLGLNFWLSVVLTIAFASALGWTLNLLVFKQLRRRRASPAILLIAGISLLFLLEALVLIFFGAGVKSIGFLDVQRGFEFAGAIITPLQAFIVVFSVVLLFLLFLFTLKTKLGKAMRAVSDNKDVAEILGISSEKIYAQTFLIGSAFAGIAAVLVGLEQNLSPLMGTNLIIKAFAGAVIGGVGSVPGAVLGAFLIGISENVIPKRPVPVKG